MYIQSKSFEHNSNYDRANDCGTSLEKAVRTPPDVRQGDKTVFQTRKQEEEWTGHLRLSGRVTATISSVRTKNEGR